MAVDNEQTTHLTTLESARNQTANDVQIYEPDLYDRMQTMQETIHRRN